MSSRTMGAALCAPGRRPLQARDLDALFAPFTGRVTRASAPTFPALRVWSNPERVIATAELPGIASEDLEISVVDDTVTLRGHKQDAGIEAARFHRRERAGGDFSRTIKLPFRIAADAVEATMKFGVLTLVLPRAEDDRPRKIQVKA